MKKRRHREIEEFPKSHSWSVGKLGQTQCGWFRICVLE